MPAHGLLNLHHIGTLAQAYLAWPVAEHNKRFLASLEEHDRLLVLDAFETEDGGKISTAPPAIFAA